MNITADTTDEQMYAPVEAARTAITRAISQARRAEDLATAVNDLAKAEGMCEARAAYRNALVSIAEHRHMDATHPEVRAVAKTIVTNLVLAGADDTWSGRGNDARRARFDGIREAVAELLAQ